MTRAWAVWTKLAPWAVLAGVWCCASPAWTDEPAGDPPAWLQQALADLRAGQADRAVSMAALAASDAGNPQHRAWAVVAAAREQQADYPSAADAWRRFLGACTSAALRDYAVERLALCQAGGIRVAPAKRSGRHLAAEERAALGTVQAEPSIKASEHFIVQSPNAALSQLLADCAEQALARITRDLMHGADYPHTVSIIVHPAAEQYAAGVGRNGEWSAGAFELSRDETGQFVRRIHLIQLGPDGQFDGALLDRTLPHELCHLVLTEWFGDAPSPLYLQEGLAMLAESGPQVDRLVLAGSAAATGKALPLEELLTRQEYPAQDRALFYAEVYSFVAYLHERLTARQFADALAELKAGNALNEALHRALSMAHDEQFMSQLEHAWRQDAIDQAQMLSALKGSGQVGR